MEEVCVIYQSYEITHSVLGIYLTRDGIAAVSGFCSLEDWLLDVELAASDVVIAWADESNAHAVEVTRLNADFVLHKPSDHGLSVAVGLELAEGKALAILDIAALNNPVFEVGPSLKSLVEGLEDGGSCVSVAIAGLLIEAEEGFLCLADLVTASGFPLGVMIGVGAKSEECDDSNGDVGFHFWKFACSSFLF